ARCWCFLSCLRQAQDKVPAREQRPPLLEPSRHRESTVADWTPRGELVRSSAYAFGRRLKDQRERQGVTLEAIAADTKINASLLAALERGDVSAWPAGIFRRAFVRGYATAIGEVPEQVVAEFGRLFPDPGTAVEAVVVPEPRSEFRMTLAFDARVEATEALARATFAVLEV